MKNFLQMLKNRSKNHLTGRKKAAIIIAGLLFFLAMWSLVDMWADYHLPAEEIVGNAMSQTLNCDSYQFEAKAVREIAEERSDICHINGVVNGANSHLFGKVDVVNSEFELYQLGDTYYRRDSADGKWLIINNFGRDAAQKLLAELSPLDFLQLTAPYEVEYLGKEIVNKEKCRKFQVLNYINTPYMTYDWQEVLLTIWIDKKGYITQAEIVAAETNEPQKSLELVIDFSAFKEAPIITAPID